VPKLSILTTDTAIPRGHNPLPLARLNSSSVSIMHLSFATGTLSALSLLVIDTNCCLLVLQKVHPAYESHRTSI
jgi:hypothetical protein